MRSQTRTAAYSFNIMRSRVKAPDSSGYARLLMRLRIAARLLIWQRAYSCGSVLTRAAATISHEGPCVYIRGPSWVGNPQL
jgi:hypothetical protein